MGKLHILINLGLTGSNIMLTLSVGLAQARLNKLSHALKSETYLPIPTILASVQPSGTWE